MVCAAALPAKARGGKSIPERWLVNGVCCRAHACSKNHSYTLWRRPSAASTTVGWAPSAPAPVVETIIMEALAANKAILYKSSPVSTLQHTPIPGQILFSKNSRFGRCLGIGSRFRILPGKPILARHIGDGII